MHLITLPISRFRNQYFKWRTFFLYLFIYSRSKTINVCAWFLSFRKKKFKNLLFSHCECESLHCGSITKSSLFLVKSHKMLLDSSNDHIIYVASTHTHTHIHSFYIDRSSTRCFIKQHLVFIHSSIQSAPLDTNKNRLTHKLNIDKEQNLWTHRFYVRFAGNDFII